MRLREELYKVLSRQPGEFRNRTSLVLRPKITGVGKAKRKTRGVRRKMQKLQREHKMLEAVLGEWIKHIRHKIKAPQSDYAPSRDVTVDVLASDVDEMSIAPSNVEAMFDYEHYFPEEVNHVIDNQVDVRSHTGSSQDLKDGYSYHGSKSTFAPGSEQMEMISGYGNEATGYGSEITGYGNGNGQYYGCEYGNGQEYGCACGNGYSDGSSFYRYYD